MRSFLLAIALCAIVISTPIFAQSWKDYQTVKLEIEFATDHGTVEIFAGYFRNSIHDRPAGFRDGSLKLEFSGALADFSVNWRRINVVKYSQYDISPVKVTILCDFPDNWNGFDLFTRKGQVGKISIKAFDQNGNLLRQGEDTRTNNTFLDWRLFDWRNLITSVESNLGQNIPESIILNQNFPNPFNPETKIQYSVPSSGHVKLTIFNMIGEVVKTIEDQYRMPGKYTAVWNGKDGKGIRVASGTYYYRLDHGNTSGTKKMVLVK